MRDREREMMEALRIEKERSEQLLLNILPKAIVTRLHRRGNPNRRSTIECDDPVRRSHRFHRNFRLGCRQANWCGF